MAQSETDICNLALGKLGEQRIASLNENTPAARACNLVYADTRDALLRSHRWNFAEKRQTLTELADEPAFGWAHQFELPADCLRVLELNDTEFGDNLTDEYKIEGRAILTDTDSVDIVFTYRNTDVSTYDALFVKALAYELAIELSEVIRGTTSKTAELVQAYERRIGPLARRIDANEGRRRKGLIALNSPAIRARGGWDPLQAPIATSE